MVDITPVIPAGKRIIQRYGGGGFTIAGTLYEHSVLLEPERVTPWRAGGLADAAEGDFEAFAGRGIELALIGTGEGHLALPPALAAVLKRLGIRAEAMSTGAACRTYNVLLSEERRVAAALIAVA